MEKGEIELTEGVLPKEAVREMRRIRKALEDIAELLKQFKGGDSNMADADTDESEGLAGERGAD